MTPVISAGDLVWLLERVKAANGPDRELDEAIALATSDEHFFAQLADAPEGTGCEMYRIGHHGFSSALRVTASIDAALALVERVLPGWSWQVRNSGYAEVNHPTHHLKDEVCHGATPPLAILAALLSALQNGGAER